MINNFFYCLTFSFCSSIRVLEDAKLNFEINSELEIIKLIILNTVEADTIYLFGSYAYGTPTEESDIDIYVVIPDESIRPIDAMHLIGSAIYKDQMKPIDILVRKSSDFNQRKLLPTLERTVARDGVLLHG